jgi:hypothetical protein
MAGRAVSGIERKNNNILQRIIMAHYPASAAASASGITNNNNNNNNNMFPPAPPPLRLTRVPYDDDEIHSLCDAVDQIRPRSHGGWMMVAQLRNRHAESLNRQWAKTFRCCRAAAAACPGGSHALVVNRPSYLQHVLDIQCRLKATRTTKNSHPLPVSAISSNDVIVSNNQAVTATRINNASDNNHIAVDTPGIYNANNASNNYNVVVTGVNISNVNDNANQHPPPLANTSGANVNGCNIKEEEEEELVGIQEERIRCEERHRYNLLLLAYRNYVP